MPTPPRSPASSESAPPACARCGKPVPAAPAPGGLCPACLLAAAFFTEPAPDAATTDSAPPPSPAELAPEFPALDIIELLGRGGMGAVYQARQRDLDRLVALKILRPGLDADPTFAARFAEEARALARLNHPGIVTLHEFGRSPGGRYFIVMEFVDGLNLRQLLATGRIAPREALAIVPPLCDALQYAHDRGLVHRDIKPENILVDRLGRVKIADFGLAKLAAPTAPTTPSAPSRVAPDSAAARASASAADLTEAGKVMGTPRYMSPEQRERPDAVDHRADIYALGVVLYQMLTGELPDEKQLQPPSRRVHIDVRLDEIVLRALEKDPALRYAAASEFKTRLETVAAQPRRPAPRMRPRHLGIILGALLLVALPFGYLVNAWRSQAASPSRLAASPAAAATIRVTISGEVARPGAYDLPDPASLFDALAAAGGWTRAADWTRIAIRAPGAPADEIHDLGAILQGEAVNPRLHPDSTLTLPARNR